MAWARDHKSRNRSYQSNWRKLNPDKHHTYVYNRNKAYKASLRAMVDSIKSNPCIDCGNSFHPFVMDLDHVRGNKISDVSLMIIRKKPRLLILTEIEKCDLVCSNCHRMRTLSRRRSSAAEPLAHNQEIGGSNPPVATNVGV